MAAVLAATWSWRCSHLLCLGSTQWHEPATFPLCNHFCKNLGLLYISREVTVLVFVRVKALHKHTLPLRSCIPKWGLSLGLIRPAPWAWCCSNLPILYPNGCSESLEPGWHLLAEVQPSGPALSLPWHTALLFFPFSDQSKSPPLRNCRPTEDRRHEKLIAWQQPKDVHIRWNFSGKAQALGVPAEESKDEFRPCSAENKKKEVFCREVGRGWLEKLWHCSRGAPFRAAAPGCCLL